jgi:predicted nucleotidyltransferase
MTAPGEIDTVILDQALHLIDERLQPAAIFLYGTAVTGKLRVDSDVDFAVLVGGATADPFDIASLRTDLEALVGRSVDLAVLDGASPILTMQVLRHGRVLFNRRPALLEDFVVKTLGAYFDLKRTRQPIEDALLQATPRP